MTKSISVVIPARESQATIRKTIESLARQTRPPDEVLVVVNKVDSTASAIEDYIANGFVTLLAVDAPAHFVRDAHWKRWMGAKAATGDVLFFTDSKVIVERHAVERSLKLMDQYDVNAVAGISPAWPDQSQSFFAKLQDSGLVTASPTFPSCGFLTEDTFSRSESLPVTTALAMSREIFAALQDDFAVDFSTVASTYDDYATAWLLVRNGCKVLTTNQVVVYHRHRTEWKELLKQISRSGQSAAILHAYYPDCPLGKKRLHQVLALFGIGVAAGTGVIALLLGFGVVGMATAAIIGFIGYLILGGVNSVRARDPRGLLFPAFTAILIFMFAIHFSKTLMRRGQFASQEVAQYLQIH